MIRVHYLPGGKVIRAVEGVAGEACRAQTAPYLQRQLGSVVKDVPTAEAELPVQQPQAEAQRQAT